MSNLQKYNYYINESGVVSNINEKTIRYTKVTENNILFLK